jgi:hypothetical protein
MAKRITEADAHELALDFAGLKEGRGVKITAIQDDTGSAAGYKVELTSDITVYVDADGNCSW